MNANIARKSECKMIIICCIIVLKITTICDFFATSSNPSQHGNREADTFYVFHLLFTFPDRARIAIGDP